ncbi:hypothetical protein ACLOJK_013201 [Asimina triloba]
MLSFPRDNQYPRGRSCCRYLVGIRKGRKWEVETDMILVMEPTASCTFEKPSRFASLRMLTRLPKQP